MHKTTNRAPKSPLGDLGVKGLNLIMISIVKKNMTLGEKQTSKHGGIKIVRFTNSSFIIQKVLSFLYWLQN